MDECEPLEPGAAARTALDAAVVRVQHEMKAQDVSNIIFAHATLLLMPAVGAWSGGAG